MSDHWFEAVADHLGTAYLRYSFTKGTEQEVDFLVDRMPLPPGTRVLDVGCGPGRHARALAARGCTVVGIDISERFVAIARDGAPPGATFIRGDARTMTFDAEFDAVVCLCQGAFGLVGGRDGDVLQRIVAALKPGGVGAVSAFSAYFQVRWLEDTDAFDADAGVNCERTVVKDEEGRDAEFDLWTSVFTPRELRLMTAAAGGAVRSIWSVTPGAYAEDPPDVAQPEFLLMLTRPAL